MSDDPVSRLLSEVHASLSARDDGHVATYIPALAAADPGWFGVALASADGHRYSAGDAHQPFTIQSISKPLVYALVLAELGIDAVLERVGLEPSGEPFNAISLEPGTGRPANPMINAGAILVTSLVPATSEADRDARVLAGLSAFAGRPLAVDPVVYRSEEANAQRNRAIAWLMHGAGALQLDVDSAVRSYLRQCSVLVTAQDLAMMAATLANGGIQPLSGARVVPGPVVDLVLTVMATCGMYDGSGRWMAQVGLPAKSGVAGGLLAVLPGQLGFGLFSPPLDAQGNPVRGSAALQALSARFGLHLMRVATRHAPVVTETRDGGRTLVCTVHGDLGFVAAERVLAAVERDLGGATTLLLDIRAAGTPHPAGEALLRAMLARAADRGVAGVVVDGPSREVLAGLPHAPGIPDASPAEAIA